MKHIHPSVPLLLLAAAVQDASAATANPDTATATRNGGPVSINVLENDVADPESESGLFIINYDQISANYGSVVLDQETNQLIYTPAEDFFGQDTFFYTADDGFGYGGTLVTVNVGTSIATDAAGATNSAIARTLDGLCGQATIDAGEGGASVAQIPQLFEVCSFLADTEDTALLNASLREIAPEEALTQRTLLAENSRNKTSRLYQAMAAMRAGKSASLSINGTDLPLGGAAGDGLGSPWTLLSSLQVGNFERDHTGNESAYDYDSQGLMLGLGYRMSSSFNMGAAFDWMAYDVGYDGNTGDLDSDIYSLTSFLSWYRNALALDMQLGYSKSASKAQRRFTILEQSVANSDYDGDQLDLSTQLDWSWQLKAWTLRPFLRLDYLKTGIDAFSETGDASWLVAAEKQNHEQLNTSAGLDTSYTLTYSWGVLVPALKLSLVNQANLSNSPVAFQLLNEETEYGRFELRADSPDSLFYQWDLSTAFIMAGGWSSFLGVQLLSGYDHVSAYQVSGGVNWEF